MLDKLAQLEARFQDILARMGDPDVVSKPARYRELATEHSQLEPVVAAYREYSAVLTGIEDGQLMMEDDDPEIVDMARVEVLELEAKVAKLELGIKLLLLPKDPRDVKNAILEIRAGTGGDEAALFAADVFRMYSRYADSRRWTVEIIDRSENAIGGFKEIICSLAGKDVFARLKHESGVHRVQRVPQTETQGRIHTSACTVAILPEADEVEFKVPDADLRVDTYRASGPGGQSVNTTDSAIRITHIPTGMIVTSQDEKSQHKNKAKAMRVMRSRLQERAEAEVHAERAAERKSQVGSGDRSERIRTYNFPQNRLTDHRIGLTLYKLDQVMMGELDQVVEPLVAHYQAELLRSLGD
jgi:peptide chain release factor 1